MALVAESRAGALRACVQEHVDVTLNEVGEQVRENDRERRRKKFLFVCFTDMSVLACLGIRYYSA